MDKFGVPKKVNRFVLKAIYFLNARGNTNAELDAIVKVVRATMRGNTPDDLPAIVLKSLRSMTKLGLIRKHGSSFSMNNKNERKEYRKSKLNPNLKKRHISESSSEGDVDKSRRRFSVNRPLAREGQGVELPNVRKSETNLDEPVDENVYRDMLKESRMVKTDQNSRKRRNLDTSTSDSASKKQKLRSRRPALRKRHKILPKSPTDSLSDMSLRNAFVGTQIITVKSTGVQTIQYEDKDDIDMDDSQNEIRDCDYESPEPTEPNEASCSSIYRHDDEDAAQQVKSASTSVDQNIRDENSLGNPKVKLETCEHPRNENDHHVTPSNSKVLIVEKQSDTKSQHSVRKIYTSNNFAKNSNMEIESNQNQDQSVKAPVQVTKPNSKERVQDIS